jgi:hypothetical protein
MVGLNTDAPQVFWNGVLVTGITEIKVDWEGDEQRVKLKVVGFDDITYNQLREAGIIVKGARHE